MGDVSKIRTYDENDEVMKEQVVKSVDIRRLMKLFDECGYFHATTKAAAGNRPLPMIWLRNTTTGEMLVYTPYAPQAKEIAEKLGIPPEEPQ